MTKQEKEIAQLEGIINNPKTSEEQKEKFRAIVNRIKGIKEFEKKVEKLHGTAKEKKAKAEKTKPDFGYNCDELIANEKERLKKKKEAEVARENAPKKTEATKAVEKLEKVEDSVISKVESGKMSKAQLLKVIKETEDLLKALKKALSNL